MISEVEDSQTPIRMDSGSEEPQSTPPMAPGAYPEPPIRIEWQTSSPAFTDTSPVGSEYSVDVEAPPRGLSFRERLKWVRETQSTEEEKNQTENPPTPSAPKSPVSTIPSPVNSEYSVDSQTVPQWLTLKDRLQWAKANLSNAATDSGRTTPHIPPEEPPYVHPDEDDDSPVRRKQRSSPQWTYPKSPEEEGPVSPLPFTIYVDDPTPIHRKRKRQSIEDVVEDGEGGSSPESPAAEEAELQRPLGHSLAIIFHTEGTRLHSRKKRRCVTPALSECSSLPTPIFRPSPVVEDEEEEGNPAVVQSDAHVGEVETTAQRSLAIVQSNPHPSRPRTYGEIRSRSSVIVQSKSRSETPESTGSVSSKPAIVLSDTRPQQEEALGEKIAGGIRATPPPVIVDSPNSNLAPPRGRSSCPTPRRIPLPKRHILDLPPYITADRNTDRALRRRRLGTSFGRRLLDAKKQEEGELKDVSKSSSTEGERKPSSILKPFEIPELFARISNKLSENIV
ncbi:uncharacterized protein DFL_001223 [Arthrobotrys flagrans]|uniref:Uncharacterized protein n=1 Tax=Arthrobotrys flagrans TaxID=97331 RepID=A0A437AGK6_ARTFL|nr:hypothetical protein DFL_001223 [Arthrobotrys flagrans]